MENNAPKIFTNKAISFATFFGGPLAACLLISKNYKVFGNDDAARNSVFIGILSTVLLFGGLFALPEHIFDHIPQPLIPTVYTGIITLLVEKLQGQKIKIFLANNGQLASNWQAARYGLFGMLVIAGFVVLIIFTKPTKGYEKEISINKNVVLHCSKKIDDEKSNKVAEILKLSKFMEESEGADIFLGTEADYYLLKFVIPDTSAHSDSMVISDFNRLEKYMNYNLNFEKRIEIGFTDVQLLNNYKLPETENTDLKIYEPLLYLQAYHVNDFHIIFYNEGMPQSDLQKVENAVRQLKAYFPVNKRIDIVFLNNGSDYTIKFFVGKNQWLNTDITGRLQSTIDYIKQCGIEKNIKLVLVDNQTFEEIQL